MSHACPTVRCRTAAAFLAVLALASAASAAATTHWVNDDASGYTPAGTSCDDAGYPTIQDAVDAASTGDVVNVCPGTYTENVAISTSGLTVISTGGASVTTVHGAVSTDVFLISTHDVTIEGFTIVPAGQFAKHDIGINVSVEGNTNANLAHNVITGGRIGINLGCASAGSSVIHNTVNRQSEAAINIDTCEGSEFGSDGNAVHHNTACGGIFSYSIAAGEKSDDNAIHHNVAMWITVSGTGNDVHHNTAEYFAIAAGNTQHHNTTDPGACP
jgi:nitrous oxidase accessory protein NosD